MTRQAENPVPTWGAEVCETPWVVQSLWWHYLYTMDKDFLRHRAFGPICEAVQFLNAYMRRPDAHGPQWKDDKFHIYPTVVPELHGLKVDPAFSADCIVDLTLTRFVFKAYLEACKVLGCQQEEAVLMREVQEILDHFPDIFSDHLQCRLLLTLLEPRKAPAHHAPEVRYHGERGR